MKIQNVLFVSAAGLLLAAVFTGNKPVKRDSSKQTTVQPASNETACDPATSSAELNVNNVRTLVLNGGDMWWDLSTQGRYEVPKNSGTNSMFAGALWIGGISSDGGLRMAAQTYRTNGNDFWPGPLDCNAETASDTCNAWDRHWKINKSTIDSFINGEFATIPDAILEWPAPWNPNIELQGSAPFVDVNKDYRYDPEDGDYPLIKGDQAIWWVFNDKGNTHKATEGAPLGIEVHAMAYAYSSNTSAALDHSTFYEFTIINRSADTIHDTYIGFFNDPDLGCAFNDYVGCDTSRNLGICYNGKAQDNSTCSPGYPDDQIPIIGTTLLEGMEDSQGNPLGMTNFISFDRDGFPTGLPVSAYQYYNYMKSVWKDETPLTYGGNGYGGSAPFPYMYPGDPSDTSAKAWSECSESHQPNDRIFLMSSGPVTFNPGDVKVVNYAVVWVDDQTYPCPSFDELKQATDIVTNFFNEEVTARKSFCQTSNCVFTYSCGGTVGIQDKSSKAGTLQIYPNPAQDIITVAFEQGLDADGMLTIYTATGQQITEHTIHARQTHVHIPVGDWSAGVYVVQLAGQDAYAAKRFVVSPH